jgi:hypothetical protein
MSVTQGNIPMNKDDLSPHWDSPLGDIVCKNCFKSWPCHYSVWIMNFHARYCNACNCPTKTLFWKPREGNS